MNSFKCSNDTLVSATLPFCKAKLDRLDFMKNVSPGPVMDFSSSTSGGTKATEPSLAATNLLAS